MFEGVISTLRARAAQAREPDPGDYIPFSRHVTEQVVEGYGGAYVAMFRAAGRTMELDGDEEIAGRAIELNEKLKALADPRRGFMVHVVKSDADPEDYPAGGCRSDFARRFNEGYRDALFSDPDAPLRRIDVYVTLAVAPVEDAEKPARHRLGRKHKAGASAEAEAARVRALEDYCAQAQAQLAGYGVARLGLLPEGRKLRTEIAEALHHLLYNERLKIALPLGRLSHAVYASRVVLGADAIELKLPGGAQFAAVLSPRVPSTSAWPAMFRPIVNAPYRYCFAHSFNFWPTAMGLGRMRLRRNQMVTARDPAASQSKLLKRFADRLQNGEFAVGDSHLSLTVFAADAGGLSPDDPARLRYLNNAAAQARAGLAEAGVSATREDIGLIAAFFAQLPTNARLRTRPGLDTTENLAADAPLDAPPRGAAKGHWGEPVLLLRTLAGTGFRFHVHAPAAIDETGDLGNTLVIGPAGSGKTVALGCVIAQAERLGAKVVVFDKDRGLEILVRALGGTYHRLRSDGMGTAPLRARPNTQRSRDFLSQLVRGFVMESGAPAPTPHEDRQVQMGLRALLDLPPEARSIGELRAFLGNTDPNGVGARLGRWCLGGPLGWVADNPEDKISFSGRVTGFDMTEILDNPRARGPVMVDLFDRIEGLLGAGRLMLVVDEFWKALLDPLFAPLVNDKLKTIRKLDGAVLLGTQSIRDVLQSPIGHTVIEQCPTKLWMPNPRAIEADHVGIGSAGLTRAKFDAIRRGRDRAFLVEQQAQSLMARLPLGRLQWALHVISGRSATLALMDELIAARGEDPARWLDEFIRRAPDALAAERSLAA